MGGSSSAESALAALGGHPGLLEIELVFIGCLLSVSRRTWRRLHLRRNGWTGRATKRPILESA
ncbi:MAG: hypothetical protein DWQ36_02780 [Acidobacteria bacterium]|nr:MAG: hypothetical protein DWQ30_02625 [Acidobacteriota bacterium]REK11051.1 MAG: hypothetical protein DWQ36_02780 [Acidobacteriota bacterium]